RSDPRISGPEGPQCHGGADKPRRRPQRKCNGTAAAKRDEGRQEIAIAAVQMADQIGGNTEDQKSGANDNDHKDAGSRGGTAQVEQPRRPPSLSVTARLLGNQPSDQGCQWWKGRQDIHLAFARGGGKK